VVVVVISERQTIDNGFTQENMLIRGREKAWYE